MSSQEGQYRFNFRYNYLKISIGNNLKHAANVSGRRGPIFLSLLTVTNKTISD